MLEPGTAGRDAAFMGLALEQARLARSAGEVPVGAVLVRSDEVIAVGANRPIVSHDPTAHAEIEVLRAAGRSLASYRLTDTTLYVTLEPCVMCASAIVHARVRRLVFGAWDPRAGAAGSLVDIFRLPGLNHRVNVFGGVLNAAIHDRAASHGPGHGQHVQINKIAGDVERDHDAGAQCQGKRKIAAGIFYLSGRESNVVPGVGRE